jgi:hypothetical protein
MFFVITFDSIKLDQVAGSLVGRECQLHFTRNANVLKTKMVAIESSGVAEFKDKIEMKTAIELDSAGDPKPKEATLALVMEDGQILGEVQMDLA